MVKRTYGISLTEENVDSAKLRLKKLGGKVSTLLDHLLEKWINEQDGIQTNR